VEAVELVIAASPDAPIADPAAVLPDLQTADPRDILHVPRSVLA
jgi:hypothetical protein